MDDTSIQEFHERLAAMKAKQRMRQKEHDLVMAVCDKAEALRAELDEAKAKIERLRVFIHDEVVHDRDGDLDLVRWKATRALKGQTDAE